MIDGHVYLSICGAIMRSCSTNIFTCIHWCGNISTLLSHTSTLSWLWTTDNCHSHVAKGLNIMGYGECSLLQ